MGGFLPCRSFALCGAASAGQPRTRPRVLKRRSSRWPARFPVRGRAVPIGTVLLSYVTMPNFAPKHKGRRTRAREFLHLCFPAGDRGATRGTRTLPQRNGIACLGSILV